MLLSKDSLNKLQEIENETKADRVRLFIDEQQEHLHHYSSPSVASSIPSSCANDTEETDAYSQAFTASISEILRRKYAANVQDKEKKKSTIEIDPSKPVVLPKAESNGFHLLEKFVSPNLEIDRVTLRSNRAKRVKVGLFNKGKSSATGKSVPDLVFSESQFLQKRKSTDKQSIIDKQEASPDISSTQQAKAPTVSRFFKQTSPSVNEEPKSAISLVPSKKRKQEKPISIGSGSSYASLIRTFHNHHPPSQQKQQEQHYAQEPLYSYMRTPSGSYLSHRFSSHSRNLFQPPSEIHLLDRNDKEDHSSVYDYYQDQLQNRGSFQRPSPYDMIHWQVDESVAPSHEKDDLELIMESPAIHLLNKQIQDHEEEMQNFWLNQSYKRKL